ncbi:Rid family hydrolase [Thermodesulfobacteriota bacterium]
MDVQHYQPAGQPDTSKNFQYSQAVRAGNLLFVAGQPGWDANMKIPESYEDECRQVFENIRSVLAEAGCGLADIVEGMSLHAADADMGIFWRIRNEYLSEPWPAWTMIANAGLGLPGMHHEVKVTAAIPA